MRIYKWHKDVLKITNQKLLHEIQERDFPSGNIHRAFSHERNLHS